MSALLSGADVRRLLDSLAARPHKSWGQNFVTDPNTVRRIVRLAQVEPGQVVLEVGPGLGSLTLALLEAGAQVRAVEIDPVLAAALPGTVRQHEPAAAERLSVLTADALQVSADDVRFGDRPPVALIANLPYNVAVPVLLTLMARVPELATALVMVQREVAERLSAGPGSRTYGVPSAKAQWYGPTDLVGQVPRSVFYPVPNVDSALVRLRRSGPASADVPREQVFAVIDAAFAQRRKMLRSALAGWAGSGARAEQVLRAAGVDPTARGESLSTAQFAAVAAAGRQVLADGAGGPVLADGAGGPEGADG